MILPDSPMDAARRRYRRRVAILEASAWIATIAVLLTIGLIILLLLLKHHRATAGPGVDSPREAVGNGMLLCGAVDPARLEHASPAIVNPPTAAIPPAATCGPGRPPSPPSGAACLPPRSSGGGLGPLFEGIRQVESSGNDGAVGDGGRSRGPYQISRAYWADGGGEPARYLIDVWDRTASERVMLGYWRRYCPAALASDDWETLARVHNGGPTGASKPATVGYWNRVRKEMK